LFDLEHRFSPRLLNEEPREYIIKNIGSVREALLPPKDGASGQYFQSRNVVPVERNVMSIFRATLALVALVIPGALAFGANPPKGAGEEYDAAWVDARVQACQPTAEERRFDQIGWLTNIRAAEQLARQHDRPVFLFTHDGHMALGRC
jgi:hypothetical protein